jgi:hypothetical protein
VILDPTSIEFKGNAHFFVAIFVLAATVTHPRVARSQS